MNTSTKPVTLLIIGAGSRGSTYAEFALAHTERAKIVGVAEPRDFYRERMANAHRIPHENIYKTWQVAAERSHFADAVIIATQDAMHAEPAIAFANLGYHILLEKPMAPNEADCHRIVQAARANHNLFAVCHVLRYRTYTQELKKMIDSGAIGEVVNIQHYEPVGYWHQAHSFVRGNWRNEHESGFMLLTKSCHDIDWLSYLIGTKCKRVASFGTLKHFRREEKPAGAADNCLDCEIEAECPYSAKKIYLGRVRRGETGWPVDVLTSDNTETGIMKALRDGPYGRCVYNCDNDVVDNQTVIMQFEGGKTASFTMTAFTEATQRKTRIFGTKGEIYGDSSAIRIFDFLTDTTRMIEIKEANTSILSGHGGGDYLLMDSFINAVAKNDSQYILSGSEETLESHRIVFAAEKARKEIRVVEIER